MPSLAGLIVVAAGVSFIAGAALVFVRPAMAERFLGSFASSARTHYLEMGLRVTFGASLITYSEAMWSPTLFRLIGWALVISSVVLLLLPWQWHHRFGEKVLPTLLRFMRVYAVGSLAFGGLLLYGVFASRRIP